MKKLKQAVLISSSVVLSVLFYSSVAGAQSLPASSSASSFLSENSISVHGVGFAETAPDSALVSFDTETRGDSAKASLAENNNKIDAIKKALSGLGVENKDMGVNGLYMYNDPYYGDSKGGISNSSEVNSYTVSQSIKVLAKDENMISDVVDAVVEAGATRIDSVSMDTLEVIYAVEQTQKNAKTATSKMKEIVEKTKKALSALGINAKKSVSSNSYSFYPNYSYPLSTPTSGSFTTTRTLLVKVKSLDKLGQIIDTAIAAGATRASNVTYSLEQSKVLQKEARALAMADAREKAEDLAAISGVKLGRIKNVNATYTSYAAVYEGMISPYDSSSKGSPGLVKTTVELDVTYSFSLPTAVTPVK